MSFSDWDVVTPHGGDALGFAALDQTALLLYNAYESRNAQSVLSPDTQSVLRVGPHGTADNTRTTIFLSKDTPTDFAPETSARALVTWDKTNNAFNNGAPIIASRWDGSTDAGAKLGFGNYNYICLDIGRFLTSMVSTDSTLSLRVALSLSASPAGMHALRLDTRTVGVDVYYDIYTHFNIDNYSNLVWSHLMTVRHGYGDTSVGYAIHDGTYISNVYTGNTHGVSTPIYVGRSGFGVEMQSYNYPGEMFFGKWELLTNPT